MAREGKHYRLELGFDLNEKGRNEKGNLVLVKFLYDEQRQRQEEMHFVAGDQLSIFLFDLTEGETEHAVVCANGKPVTKEQTLEYIFEPWDTKHPPSLENPFEGCHGKNINRTEALLCTPEITSSWTATWWGPAHTSPSRRAFPASFLHTIWRLIRSCFPGGRQGSREHGEATALLNIILNERFMLTTRKKHAHDMYDFSMRLEIGGKVWSFDPQMIVDEDLDGPG